MSRYIDADRLHDDLTKTRINLMQEGVDVTPIWQALDCVRQQPTADVRENVKGEWTEEEHADFYINATFPVVHCNRCDYRTPRIDGLSMNFCPNCGADMRGEVCEVKHEVHMSNEKFNKILAYTLICLAVYAAILMAIMCLSVR